MMMDPVPGAVAAAMQPVEGDGEIASPEEQEQYEIFVGMSLMALYDKTMMPDTIAMLRDGGNLIEGIATVASSIVMRVLEAAQAAGQQVGGDVLLHAGREITENVAEMAERGSGQDIPEADIERAFYTAVDRFRSAAQRKGLYTEEDVQGDISALQDMERRGVFAAAPSAPPAARGLGSAMQPAVA